MMEKYRYCFETEEFAVYCKPGDESNYRVFRAGGRMRLPHFILPEDYMIVCGAFRLVRAKDRTFEYNLKRLSKLPFTVLWVHRREEPRHLWRGRKLKTDENVFMALISRESKNRFPALFLTTCS